MTLSQCSKSDLLWVIKRLCMAGLPPQAGGGDGMTLTKLFNICDECAYCPSLCGSDPEICVREYAKLHQQPEGVNSDDES